jgi:3'-phosphoadenosine 5'-phosphosulfate sulfotransferase (PAPS reductase)/FAD synthetase
MSTSPVLPAFRTVDGRTALIVNFGGGVDSTAILVGLARLYRAGDTTARPDLILFSDTGDEVPETYRNVARIDQWARGVFGLGVTTVSRPSVIPGKVGYRSLSENCVTNETLPSEAFGFGGCSVKWKHEPMDRFLRGSKRPERAGWLRENGYDGRPLRLIGYDATEAVGNGKRAKNSQIASDEQNLYRYPLVEWGWTRQDCEAAIAAEGLPVVVKSACFLCPNQTEDELRALSAGEGRPLFLRSLAIEEIARRGRNGLTQIEGLWRRTRKFDGRPGSWCAWAQQQGLATAAEIEALVAKLAPHLAAPVATA